MYVGRVRSCSTHKSVCQSISRQPIFTVPIRAYEPSKFRLTFPQTHPLPVSLSRWPLKTGEVHNSLVANMIAGISLTFVDVSANSSVSLETRQTPAEERANDIPATRVTRTRRWQEQWMTLVDVWKRHSIWSITLHAYKMNGIRKKALDYSICTAELFTHSIESSVEWPKVFTNIDLMTADNKIADVSFCHCQHEI